MYDSAIRVYKEKRYDEAVDLLRRALENEGRTDHQEELLFKLSVALDALGRSVEALVELKNLLEMNRDSARAWNNIGIICRRLGKHEESRSAFETACRLEPGSPEPFVNLASSCLQLGDPANALEYSKAAVELAPGHAAAHANIALALAVFGRLEEAEDELRLAVLYGFENADAIQQRIDALKEIREQMLRDRPQRASASPASDDITQAASFGADETVTGDGEAEASGGESEMLMELEREMHSLAERRYGRANHDDEEITVRMNALRKHIRSMRKRLGMDEVLDSDVVMGINYMQEEQ